MNQNVAYGADIEVSHKSGADPLAFHVRVNEGGAQTLHRVTMSRDFAAQFPQQPECLVRAAFRFLLDREPKESILSRFDISAIATYFPEFAREMPRYLAGF